MSTSPGSLEAATARETYASLQGRYQEVLQQGEEQRQRHQDILGALTQQLQDAENRKKEEFERRAGQKDKDEEAVKEKYAKLMDLERQKLDAEKEECNKLDEQCRGIRAEIDRMKGEQNDLRMQLKDTKENAERNKNMPGPQESRAIEAEVTFLRIQQQAVISKLGSDVTAAQKNCDYLYKITTALYQKASDGTALGEIYKSLRHSYDQWLHIFRLINTQKTELETELLRRENLIRSRRSSLAEFPPIDLSNMTHPTAPRICITVSELHEALAATMGKMSRPASANTNSRSSSVISAVASPIPQPNSTVPTPTDDGRSSSIPSEEIRPLSEDPIASSTSSLNLAMGGAASMGARTETIRSSSSARFPIQPRQPSPFTQQQGGGSAGFGSRMTRAPAPVMNTPRNVGPISMKPAQPGHLLLSVSDLPSVAASISTTSTLKSDDRSAIGCTPSRSDETLIDAPKEDISARLTEYDEDRLSRCLFFGGIQDSSVTTELRHLLEKDLRSALTVVVGPRGIEAMSIVDGYALVRFVTIDCVHILKGTLSVNNNARTVIHVTLNGKACDLLVEPARHEKERRQKLDIGERQEAVFKKLQKEVPDVDTWEFSAALKTVRRQMGGKFDCDLPTLLLKLKDEVHHRRIHWA